MNCFELNGVRICIPDLLLVPWWWKDPPDPWPWLVTDPRIIPEEFQKDFSILAIVDELSKRLSPARGKVIQGAIQDALRDLPKGVTLVR
jgi:hypothetical protein